jgi:recombination protein RecT
VSNHERKTNLPAVIKTAEATFTELARRHNVPDFTFAREAEFAMQILKENDYLSQVACGNQDSLKDAIINVAAIGLSLSPIKKLAFLVPRKKKVCLDISYQGFIELATSKGIILWAKPVIVHDEDEFEYQGVNKEPIHKFHPFKDRGPIVGGYVLAKMSSGDLLVDFMPIHEIYAIRDRSEGWKAYKAKQISTTPWASDEGEMIKKTLVRRAQKSWPKSVASEALDRAVAAVDETDGVELRPELSAPATEAAPNERRLEGFAIIRELLEALDRTEEAYVEHLCRTTNRKITKIEDLTELEVDQAVTMLQGIVDAQAAKLEKLKSQKEQPA